MFRRFPDILLVVSIAFFIGSFYYSQQSSNQMYTNVLIEETEEIEEIAVVPVKMEEEPHGDYYSVNFKWLNVREGPSTKTALVKRLHQNDMVELIEKVDERWYKIKVLDTLEVGFVASEYLTKIDQPTNQDFSVPILMYHHIGPISEDNEEIKSITVTSERFEEQMKWLSDSKIRTITFADALVELNGSSGISMPVVILTFDDGYKDNIENGLPILQKYNLKGVFFIITGFVGQDDYMNWDDIRKLKEAGMEIGSHAVTHTALIGLTDDQNLRNELIHSKRALKDQLGVDVISFCYPLGEYDDRVLQFVKEAGYMFARTTHNGKWTVSDNWLTLPAKKVFDTTGVASLEYWVEYAEKE